MAACNLAAQGENSDLILALMALKHPSIITGMKKELVAELASTLKSYRDTTLIAIKAHGEAYLKGTLGLVPVSDRLRDMVKSVLCEKERFYVRQLNKELLKAASDAEGLAGINGLGLLIEKTIDACGDLVKELNPIRYEGM